MIKQRTIKNRVSSKGISLHSGKVVHINLIPAPTNTGIIFKRVDLIPHVEIEASIINIGDTILSTSIKKGDVFIRLIEHIMATLSALCIDNIIIEVDGNEMPIMDGSSADFIFLLESAGICEQQMSKEFIIIDKPIKVEQSDKIAKLEPYDGLKFYFELDFKHKIFEHPIQKKFEYYFSGESFIKDISRARTFGFLKDLNDMHSKSLALGGNINNAILIGDEEIVNEEGLRFNNEFLRHKILDAIGDLFLLGKNVVGSYTGIKSGHNLNSLLLEKIIKNKNCWHIETFETPEQLPYQLSHIA